MGTRDLPSKSSPRSLIYCEENRRLLEAFGDSVHKLLRLHEQQFLAITSDDPDGERFDLLIHLANEEKLRAKYAYLQHMENHGCSTDDDIHET